MIKNLFGSLDNLVNLADEALTLCVGTSRHVVDRIIAIMQPQIGESIYDPACGTGGFIVRAFEWVRRLIGEKRISGVKRENLVRDLKQI